MSLATLSIGGVFFDAWLERESLSHVDNLIASPDTLDFNLNFQGSGAAACPIPSVGAEVIYTMPPTGGILMETGDHILMESGGNITPEGRRLFGGVLSSAPQVKQGFLAVGYTCSCTDWRVYADRKTLNEWLTNITPGALIVYLFAKYAPEFDTSGVDITGPLIPSYRCKRSDRLTGVMADLAKLTGYMWDVTPYKKIVWSAPGTIPAPFGLTDTSYNFLNLTVTTARDQLQNRVIIKGAKYPATVATVDRFTGDGLTTAFRLSKQPYGTDGYLLFEEKFASLNLATWGVANVTNPAPPAGHIASDGYIFTTTQVGAALTESGFLQVVGGDAVWGDVRLSALVPLARGDGYQRFEMDVYPTDTTGFGRVGLWDPSAVATSAGEVYGVYFNAGTVYPSEAGVQKTALAVFTYTNTDIVRVRIIPNATTGAETWVNKDAANQFQGSQWVHLYTSATGSQALLTVTPCFNNNLTFRVGRTKVLKRLYNVALTVAAVAETVGVLNVDADGGLDAVIGTEAGDAPVLAFYPDKIPAAAAAIVITYYESIPIMTQADDFASQATIKALENPTGLATGSDGIYEGYLEDPLIDTLARARMRALAQLDEFSNPLVTVAFDTYADGLMAGQTITAALTLGASGRDLAGSYLIQDVHTQSLGSGKYVYSITAGSRLKGFEEYVLGLLIGAKALTATQSDNSPLDVIVAASDTLTMTDSGLVSGPGVVGLDTVVFTDSGSVVAGALPPYIYADAAGNVRSASFSRTSPAYDPYTGALTATGLPRFPSIAGTVGVMVEEGTTNTGTWAQAVNDASYSKVRATVTADAIAAPGGTTTADLLIASVGAGTHYVTHGSLTPAAPGAFSVFAKAGGLNYLELTFDGSSTQKGYFDLSLGTVTNTTGVNTYIRSLGNGWYWCAISTSSVVTGTPQIMLCGTSNTNSFTGNGVSGVYLWDVQIEAKAYPTSPMFTNAATATRALETLTIPGSFVTPAQGAIVGRFYVDGDVAAATALNAGGHVLFDISDGTANNRVILFTGAGTPATYTARISSGGTAYSTPAYSVQLSAGWHTFLIRWGGGNVYLYIDGVQRGTIAGTSPVSLSTALFTGSSFAGLNQWSNPIAWVATFATDPGGTLCATYSGLTDPSTLAATADYSITFNSTLAPTVPAPTKYGQAAYQS
jgi:hypothetical protein